MSYAFKKYLLVVASIMQCNWGENIHFISNPVNLCIGFARFDLKFDPKWTI